MSVKAKMTAIADEIRELSGTSGAMGLDAMATNLGDANDEVVDQADLIAQIASALEGKASGDGETSTITLQNKTVNPSLVEQVVSADSGYDGLDEVTVTAMPTATQATPSISIDVSGKITASAMQSAGYVEAGTKSATKQLTTKTATTYTPTTTNQTIAAGTYCSGIQTIAGDANLVPANIVSGKTIFGVAGSAEIGGQPSGVCPSLTIDSIAEDSFHYGVVYSTNGQYIVDNNGGFEGDFPITIQNIDIKRPVIIISPGCHFPLLVLNYTNLEILADRSNDFGIMFECTSTEAATLTLEEEGLGLG